MTPSNPIHVLSLGAGVQSSTLALMAAAGEVTPMPTAAIFADTQDEPKSVYRWLDWLEKQLPFPVIKVTEGKLSDDVIRKRISKKSGKPYLSTAIPVHYKIEEMRSLVVGEDEDGEAIYGEPELQVSTGIGMRTCTMDFKITPIRRELQKLRNGGHVFQWIGISLDEAHRMKTSRDKWATNVFPLIDKRMNRHDCLRWMAGKGFPVPPRSACTYCPFRSDHQWRKLRDEEPNEFSEAVAFEKRLQSSADGVMRGVPFLHKSLLPLSEVDFSTDTERGQGMLANFGNECEGMCGV